EYESLLPDIKLQLLEPIRADQTLFRLNLRAYKALHQPVKPLISLFLDTSKLSSGSNADLKDTWAAFIDLCMGGKLEGFEISAVQQFSRWLEQEDYPAVHHSEVYHREYRPSYRLIADQFIQSLEAIDAG
ncbi:MAG TPA: hypothetical protein VLD65_14030, partial [Anaerolineales bacterium]|nr:hypothetical protein [Anaerolineales bacterium]